MSEVGGRMSEVETAVSWLRLCRFVPFVARFFHCLNRSAIGNNALRGKHVCLVRVSWRQLRQQLAFFRSPFELILEFGMSNLDQCLGPLAQVFAE